MGRIVVTVELFLCLGSLLALRAEAVRTHGSFATSTYYPDSESATDIPDRNPMNSQAYKPQTASEYTVANQESTADPAGERYPHGYYPQSEYTKANNYPFETQRDGVIGSQYSRQTFGNQQSVDPAGERYPHGYYPYSTYAGRTLGNPSESKSYSAASSFSSSQTVDRAEERYPHGYYPDSQYVKNSQSSSTTVSNNRQSNGVHFSAQTTNELQTADSSGERYPHGYYPNSHYTQGQTQTQSHSGSRPGSQSVSYSSDQGSFNSLPYGNNAGELPFELTGAGCRTSYWIENVAKWPQFFNERSTVVDAFGSKAKDVYGDTTIMQGLLKYGTDPYSELLRSGCTAILNSYTRGAYGISHVQVIEEFNDALGSTDAAATQSLAFETANVESISAGNACT